ncbi:VOC family protein [Streptomyces sp. NPDC052396]|uniref:VOC family protein n=1 Tax=Streptomyces sp. NPDC052396 TaxID=3365689 RepID=UPI0037D56DAF
MSAATGGNQGAGPCWADVTLPDLNAGKRFYGELFGWTFQEGDARFGQYAQALHQGARVAALAPKTDGRMPTAWTVYFASDDASATAGRIRSAGGQVITGPVAVGEYGTVLLAVDPGGAVFGVWQAGTHRGFEKRGEVGSFGWTEVYTRDPAAVDAFYAEVFGFRSMDLSGTAGIGYAAWTPAGEPATHDHAIGGRAVMDDRFPAEMPAHFLVYFVVDDCDAAAYTALQLHGRVRRQPEDTPHGRYAVLTDDQGADFVIIDPTRARPKAGG